jgi:hypothetical protein
MPEIKTIAVAVLLLVIVISGFVLWQNQSNTTPTATPAPTISPKDVIVTTTTASPSNVTHGLVTITANVENKDLRSETFLVAMQIKEPNGDLMTLPNSTKTVEVVGNCSNSVVFEPMIPLNSKIGEFKVSIDVNDSKQQNIRYYSTDFNCSFTTPIKYVFFVHSIEAGCRSSCWMTVDGQTYHSAGEAFYWYLGTNHTVTFAPIIKSEIPRLYWVVDIETMHVNVTADAPTEYAVGYGPYFYP